MMTRNFHDIAVSAWRAAAEAQELSAAVARIQAMLRDRMPIGLLRIVRIDRSRARLGNHALAAAEVTGIEAWCRGGKPVLCNAGTLPVSIPPEYLTDAKASLIVGPLVHAGEPVGIAILSAAPAKSFRNFDLKLAAALLDPLAAAVMADIRYAALVEQREAADADRRSLLVKLGRSGPASGSIVGIEAGLKPVMERVERVAGADVPVLLFGETGAGKELIARAVHVQSGRAAGPFLRVNCGAIAPELIDSQLFGHERGSFTGAFEQRRGWFERAHGGTLFLDEIGDLPPAAQVRLLRILQDGVLERVGGQAPVNVDVRVIGATHRDLPAMVRAGTFRDDLWYRLAVFPISIPPLRERVEDIGPLACHFAERAAVRFGLPLVMPSVDDIRLLNRYAWPGNVRELAAVIDRAALLGNGRRLEVATSLGGVPIRAIGPPAEPQSPAPLEIRKRLSMDEAAREHIERALRASHGRVEGPFGAAAQLRVNPNTLRSRMKKLGIDGQRFRDSG